jgi:hypothetical protein
MTAVSSTLRSWSSKTAATMVSDTPSAAAHRTSSSQAAGQSAAFPRERKHRLRSWRVAISGTEVRRLRLAKAA